MSIACDGLTPRLTPRLPKEIKKAEAVFPEKLLEVEAKVVKKADEIKKNLKK